MTPMQATILNKEFFASVSARDLYIWCGIISNGRNLAINKQKSDENKFNKFAALFDWNNKLWITAQSMDVCVCVCESDVEQECVYYVKYVRNMNMINGSVHDFFLPPRMCGMKNHKTNLWLGANRNLCATFETECIKNLYKINKWLTESAAVAVAITQCIRMSGARTHSMRCFPFTLHSE